jgi:signal transduction histidine kinase
MKRPHMSTSADSGGSAGVSAAATASRYERLLEVQTLMARVSREIGPAVDLDHVLGIVLEAVRELVPCEGGSISLADRDGTRLLAASYPSLDVPPREADTFGQYAIDTGLTLHARDLRLEDTPTIEARDRALDHGVRSVLVVPLVCLGERIGAMAVFSGMPEAFDEQHVVLVEGLAAQVAGTIESARRYQAVTELEVLKSDFIARVSHELRTPITIMSGFLSTLLSHHDQLDHDARIGMLERVDVATSRLSGLIDQLLMLSRLEAGVVAATIEPVDIARALDEVRRQSANPEHVDITCADRLQIVSDRALLVRGLGFIVDNALKYAGSCRIDATERRIEVLDKGPGIPKAERSRVFERFTRATADTTIAGMGIGLPIARTLLGAAGADLSIEDTETGHGCRVVARWV